MMRQWLPPAAQDLLESLPRGDQRHGLDVARALLASGHANEHLLAAALLHDAGKAGAGLTIFHRSAVVLLEAGRSHWLEALGEATESDWRRPFWRHLHHAETGAQLALETGCSEVTAWLIANHHRPAGEAPDECRRKLLETLQHEDDSY